MLNSEDIEMHKLAFVIMGKDPNILRGDSYKRNYWAVTIGSKTYTECLATLNRMEYFGDYINDEDGEDIT